ncbi:MAG: hypothetical protein Q7R66_04260 [Undibacterium sp.]|uniref:hypothetical protein n=1 Tax=Undibacterium sp. TaxID=1914977 RepID=UPI002725F5FE|nr:hypothetical protein [Undibacterium sp.]MDO8651382.1 hypothetical protein [Undibacterium sp.]
MNKFLQRGTVSPLAIAALMMLLTLLGLAFLYSIRYGHFPLQDVWSRWGKSATIITHELKKASGVQTDVRQMEQVGSAVQADAGMRQAATVDSGIRRCSIHGKMVYSDIDCVDSNPSTRAVKLYDNKGFEAPKIPVPVKVGNDDPDVDLRMKMIDKMVK